MIEYFGVLIDTLFATYLEPWKNTKKRKPTVTSKFYFFDNGVIGQLQERGEIKYKSPSFGPAFETYIYHELRTFLNIVGQKPLHYWRSTSNFEVDFIYDNRIAIEVKGKDTIGKRDLVGLRALKEEGLLERYIVVSLCENKRVLEDEIEIYPWKMDCDDCGAVAYSYRLSPT